MFGDAANNFKYHNVSPREKRVQKSLKNRLAFADKNVVSNLWVANQQLIAKYYFQKIKPKTLK